MVCPAAFVIAYSSQRHSNDVRRIVAAGLSPNLYPSFGAASNRNRSLPPHKTTSSPWSKRRRYGMKQMKIP